MLLTRRRTLLIVSLVVMVFGLVLFLRPDARWLAVVIAACGALSFVLLLVVRAPYDPPAAAEDDQIGQLSEERHREMMRGTSLYLRDMRYRYSVRPPGDDSGERGCFTAEVNTIRLGFLPAIITDNTNDRQGRGFVAFVYDGNRWRGPGLPCPGDQAEAVRHAAKCVSPLSTEEETSY